MIILYQDSTDQFQRGYNLRHEHSEAHCHYYKTSALVRILSQVNPDNSYLWQGILNSLL